MSSSPFDPSASIDLMVELMQNACVNTGAPDSGNEIRSVRSLQQFIGEDGTVFEPLPGRGNVVFRCPGTDPNAPTLLLIPHLDVVPADARDWRFDPFGAVRAEGFIWGRGAVDMLNVTAAMANIYRGLTNGSLPAPKGDVILAAVADEEAGGQYGAIHLIEEAWETVACDVVLTEVAGPRLGDAIPVTVAEKGPAWRNVSMRGIAGHGSQPYGRSNAVVALARVLETIATADQPILITDEWSAFVAYLPVPAELRTKLKDPDQVDAAIDEIAADDPVLARWIHACTHLTFSPNVFHGGTKANMVPDAATADIDIRMLPGQDADDITDHLRKVLGPDTFDELEIEPIIESLASASPAEGPMWEAMGDAAEKFTGSRELAPALTPVTTDARFFRERGIPAYGVGLFDDSMTFAEMLGMFHGADERVSEKSVISTTEFLATTIERFWHHA